MFQIRLHGRGGQGVVTAAELLSVTAFLDGRQAQAFPSFGSERMGAPVVSFCRVDDTRIRSHEPVTEPDAVIVIDATLLHHVDLFSGLAADGYVLINSSRSPGELGLDDLRLSQPSRRVVTVAATELAREHVGRPLPNVCLLGAFAALTGAIRLEPLEQAVRQRFSPAVAAANIRAAHAAAQRIGEVSNA